MSELRVFPVEKQGLWVLNVDGYINAHTVQKFEQSLQDLLKEEKYQILLNCRDLSYINSSGLGVLMGSIDEIQEKNGFLWLCDMNETVFHIFDTLGFTHLFPVYQNEEEAFSKFNSEEPPS
ncbi:MAG: anti-anti-sigma factor [Acidobacteria bacterium]|nr:MAG: anti-anti-sigma factor [Acidobacteriota bacterium]PIE89364.1 MAG: anti-anti-sigma factor [Acidobacteriota bacterium]